MIVAESYGGPVAINLAARQPNGLKGIVFVVTFARPPRYVPRFLLPLIWRLPVRSPRGHHLMFRITGWPWISRQQIEAFVTVATAVWLRRTVPLVSCARSRRCGTCGRFTMSAATMGICTGRSAPQVAAPRLWKRRMIPTRDQELD